jgi:hypothetical protein
MVKEDALPPAEPSQMVGDSARQDGPLLTHDRTPDPLPVQTWPPKGNFPVMVYDSRRQRIVLFPGSVFRMAEGGNTRFPVWEWDGVAWTDRTSPSAAQWPTPRSMVGVAYDSHRGVVVVFGGVYGLGVSTSGFSDETWEWNGATFTQRQPAVAPTARNLHAMAYDQIRKATLMFGGQNLDELWQWDAVAWTNLTPTPRPAAWPSPRQGSSLVWDSRRQRMILFGGQFTAEIWEWDGTTWMALTPTPLPEGWAFKRQSHAAAYDPGRGVMLVFGGLINDRRSPIIYGYGGDLWEWNPTERIFGNLTPTQPGLDWPLPTYGPAGAFDVARNRLVIFGGESNLTDISRELHEFGP